MLIPGSIFTAVLSLLSATSAPLPWRWVTERVIAPAEGSAGELGQIISMTIADDGTVYAMQKKPATVLVFGPDGKYLRTIGSEGSGPGELRSGVIGISGKQLVVHDWAARRITFYQPDGKVIASWPSLCCRSYSDLHVDDAGRAWVSGPDRARSIFLRIDASGKGADTIVVPAEKKRTMWTVVKPATSTQGIEETWSLPAPGQPADFFLPRHDGLIVRGSSDSMHFVLSKTGSDVISTFDGPTIRFSLSAAERQATMEGMINSYPVADRRAEFRKIARVSDIPSRTNAWGSAELDRDDRLWVIFTLVASGAGAYGVFDRSGKYLGEVPLPVHRPTQLSVMGRDRMVILEESDAGLPQIRVLRLEKR